MRKVLGLVGALALAVGVVLPAAANEGSQSTPPAVGSAQQVKITNNGKVQLDGVKVTAISAPTITVTSSWGSTVLTWSIKTSTSTSFIRRYEGGSSFGEIGLGDLLSVRGSFDTSTTQPTVNATWVKDWSIQTANSTFRGTIQSIDTSAKHLVLLTNGRGTITVQASDTTQVRRGAATIAFSDLTVGETVTASGLYNNLSLVLQATKITAKQPERRTFTGTLRSLAGSTKPTSLVLTVGDTDYTVQLAADTSVLNFWWARANLINFTVGNKLQVFGSLRPGAVPMTTIDATVVRDTDLR